jgi:uncharacterized protein
MKGCIEVRFMMLRFGTSNWRSLRDFQELSLVATALKDGGPAVLDVPSLGIRVLPGAAIYGANASGKSNFLSAISFLRTLVLTSHSQGKPDSEISLTPFRLDPAAATRGCQFLIDFLHNDVRFHFGVEIDPTRVRKEYLYAYPQRRRQLWYEREGENYTFGKTLRGENKATQSITRSNSLFLSAAVASNHEQLSAVAKFFDDSLVFSGQMPRFSDRRFAKYLSEIEYKNRIVAFLQAADLGISDLQREIPPITEKDREVFVRIGEFFRTLTELELPTNFASEESIENARAKLLFTHKGSSGDVALELESESRGTQQLLSLLAPILHVLDHGHTLFVDELDTSLHPLLSKKLISLFGSAAANPKGAQLIFTTHDTNLLDPTLLRRDQIWFAEKNLEGASSIYPLSDIQTRRSDNIERGYLEGRYGAIPFLGNFDVLIADGKSTANDGSAV